MNFSAFSSFFQKLAFQRSKSQLKNLPFVSTFGFSAEKVSWKSQLRSRNK
jgi:hypothetical protein